MKLAPKALDLLRFLLERAGDVITKDEVFRAGDATIAYVDDHWDGRGARDAVRLAAARIAAGAAVVAASTA